MDATRASEAKDTVVEPQPESLTEKRSVENGGDEELADRCSKRPKLEATTSVELKRVAEIVLVLSTMATMRGGRKPADVEIELMKEARSKLVELCQGIAPKDIVAREAIGTVIEGLGLNGKNKDQRLGFRTPKMSIAERFSHTKWKMEESKKFSVHSRSYTFQAQPLQTSIGGGTIENRIPSHPIRMLPSDKSSHMAISSFVTLASTSIATSTTLQHQSTGNETRAPMVSSGMTGSHLGRNPSSLPSPKVEQAQFKVDGASNASYVLHVQANQPLVTAPTWSIQTQSASLARSAPENKVPGHTSVKVEGMVGITVSSAAPQVARDQNFKPFITQTAPGRLSSMHQPSQSMNMIQPPSQAYSHAEIVKVVQKLLQPKLPEHPAWTPPSRDYMNKALTCQMCELTVNEVDTVLLCDACEKGFHLKCLQPSILRGIPRGEWHCMRCLTISGGKPLPPKYGRVMRSSITPPKVPSNTIGFQPSLEKKAGVLDPQSSTQKLTTNRSTVAPGANGNNNVEPQSDTKIPKNREIPGDTISSSIKHMDEKPDPVISVKPLIAASSPAGLLGESAAQQVKTSETSTCTEKTCNSEPEILSKLPGSVERDNLELLQTSQLEQTVLQYNAEGSSSKCLDISSEDNNQKESHGGETLIYDITRDDQDVALANSDGSLGINTEGRQFTALSSDCSHSVEYIGDVIQLVDEKKFYQSCCVDGVIYRLQDYALFPTSKGKLTPSKLQSMWEDSKTGLKWISMTQCYFPADLPGNIAHPCISEVNEVFESNSVRTEKAGCIRGPCEVLPSGKLKQETDKRSQLGLEASARLHPSFLCRWFYDEVKKLFQPVTS